VTATLPAATGTVDDSRPRLRVTLEQGYALAKRSVLSTWRTPGAWIPGLVLPLMIAAVYSAQFATATKLPEFPPVDSFLQYMLPASVLQSIAFGAGNAGTDLATDIENGFFDRLMASPVARQSVLIGRIMGAAVFSAFEALILILVFLGFGAPVRGGVGGVLAIIFIAGLLSIAVGGFGVAVALRTGSPEATQSMFPLTFVFLFMSSAFFPTALMRGWYQKVAESNPFTFIIDPTRRLVIQGWSWTDLGQAIAMTLVVAAVSLSWAYRMYLRRLDVK